MDGKSVSNKFGGDNKGWQQQEGECQSPTVKAANVPRAALVSMGDNSNEAPKLKALQQYSRKVAPNDAQRQAADYKKYIADQVAYFKEVRSFLHPCSSAFIF